MLVGKRGGSVLISQGTKGEQRTECLGGEGEQRTQIAKDVALTEAEDALDYVETLAQTEREIIIMLMSEH